MENEADSSSSLCGSFAWYDPDSSSWKTCQAYLFGGWEEFLESWPKAGTMRNGAVYRLPTLVPRTSGIGSSLWRSPQAANASQGPKSEENFKKAIETGHAPITLTDQVKRWPTPRAIYGEHPGMKDPSHLTGQVQKWPTPNANPTRPNEGNIRILREKVLSGEMTEGEAREMLNGKSPFEAQGKIPAMWPTPTTRDHKDGSAESCKNVPVNSLLGRAIHQWPTPASQSDGGGVHGLDGGSGARKKLRERTSETEARQMASGSLNPQFVEWLMGLPTGFTDCEDSATPSSPK